MTGHWFLDLLIILFLALCVCLYWPGNLERIKCARARLQAKHRKTETEIKRMKKK